MHPARATGEARRWIGDRYEVRALLGRGGVGRVYRVLDTVSGRALALKWLELAADPEWQQRYTELFEREFHTLIQLAHPRVVQAYDYGVDAGNPYYTTELLDGGDLRQLAPMPWKDVCRVAYDVCSALSLLHSRGLLHLDITPSNIRRTAEGESKIIDFGLLAPMGPRAIVAGTPSFIAPEALRKQDLDARTDLFSLGATLYYALTGRPAYPASRLHDLELSWRTSPPPPSLLVKDVPPALEGLILSLVRLDPACRPKTAAEVMERLRPLLGRLSAGRLSVRHAYLSTPLLVGRDPIVAEMRTLLCAAFRGAGGGFLFAGPAGIGRSRVLDAFVVQAKLAGFVISRAGAGDGAGQPFGVAAALARKLCAQFPEEAAEIAAKLPDSTLRCRGARQRPVEADDPPALKLLARCLIDITRPGLDRASLQSALRSWLIQFAKRRPLAIAVDDLHQIDEPSAALLATLATEAADHALAYAATLATDERCGAAHPAEVLRANAKHLELSPLSQEETMQLLASVFGDVPNLQLLSNRVHRLCGGRPRDCMALAGQLVDDGTVSYADGTWSLPEAFAAGQLPRSMEDVLARQVGGLSDLAKHVAVLLGLALLRRLSRDQLLRLDGMTAADLDHALMELSVAELIFGEPSAYALRHEDFARQLLPGLSQRARRERHRELAHIHQSSGGDPILIAYHLLSSDEPARGLDVLMQAAPDASSWEATLDRALVQLGVDDVAQTLQLALAQAERAGCCTRVLLMLRERLAHMSAMGDDPAYYYGVASACLAQYKRDSGYDDLHALDASLPAEARIQQAVAAASRRYEETPPAERVLSPREAIQGMVRWVVISLPIGTRTGDLATVGALPQLLEPFAPLNPVVALMAKNARASRLYRCEGRWQEARALWREVLQELETSGAIDMVYLAKVRTAIGSTLSGLEASLGIRSSLPDQLERGDHDPLQLAQVISMKKVAALYAGDWEAAEQSRRRAEQVRLRTRSYQPISTLTVELIAHAAARDLTGIKQVRSAIHAMAEKYAGWIALRHFADACYCRLRGDLKGGLEAVDLTIEHARRQAPWNPVPTAPALKTELLVELDRPEEALAYGLPALASCSAAGAHHAARDISRALSLAEAKLGRFAAARARAQQVVTAQQELGIAGLQLGLSYEACARIAIWAQDAEQFKTYAALTAECYRAGTRSALGALYERLQEEARQAGLIGRPQCDLDPLANADREPTSGTLMTRLTSRLRDCESPEQRALGVLRALCASAENRRGHLFLLAEHGLELAASTASPETRRDALAFADHFIQQELTDGETALLTSLELDAAPSPRTHTWTGPDSTQYHAVLLTGARGGRMWVAGAAMLDGDGASLPFELAGVAAKWLLERGDAAGAVALFT